jgi:hypothetical protein
MKANYGIPTAILQPDCNTGRPMAPIEIKYSLKFVTEKDLLQPFVIQNHPAMQETPEPVTYAFSFQENSWFSENFTHIW